MTTLRRFADAGALDEEIIRRFGSAPEPELGGYVVHALGHHAYVRLREGRTQDALDDGDALLTRFREEADPGAQHRIAEILLDHARALERSSGSSRWRVAGFIGRTFVGVIWEGGRRFRKRVPGGAAPHRRIRGVGALSRALGFDSIIETRRRMKQAVAVSRVLVAQYESTDEAGLRQLVARARIIEAAAVVSLGRVGEGFRAFDALTKSGDEAVAEAFKAFATAFKSEGGFHGDFASISLLSHRAATLGQGDPRITRMAYEESTRPGTRGSPATRAGTMMARLLAPGKPLRRRSQ